MAQVTVETVTLPAWWSGATTVNVKVDTGGGGTFTFSGVSTANVEMLPQGISLTAVGSLTPWARVMSVEKAS